MINRRFFIGGLASITIVSPALAVVIPKAVNFPIDKDVVFEFNDSITRETLRKKLIEYYQNLRNQRKIYDFSIICDDRNNTPQVIDNGELVFDVYIKPMKTANYICLNFVTTKSNISFEEIIDTIENIV